MMLLRNMAIRHKLVAIAMLTSAVAILMSSVFQLLHRRDEQREYAVKSLSCHAEIIGENCKAALAFEDAVNVEETLQALSADQSVVFACVYAKDNRVLARYPGSWPGIDSGIPTCRENRHVFEHGYLKLFRQVTDDDVVLGTVYLQYDLGEMKAAFRSELRSVVLVGVAALSIAYLMSSRLQRIVSAPILRLAQFARAVSEEKDCSKRVERMSNDETGLLIDAFNEMLEQIHRRDLELVQSKEHLETKVAGRTRELSEANSRLKDEIAQRLLIEKSLQNMNDKLAQSNRQLEEFTYVASHDLREPTRKITAFGQLLEESLGDRLDEDDAENLNFMVDGANRMQQMIEALLEYSRVTTRAVEFEHVDLNEIVEQLTNVELAVMLDESGCVLNVPCVLPIVRGGQAQIRQLLQNLVSNAIKYQKKGAIPEVTICTREQSGGMVRVEVQDKGIGIKREQLENVFVMFRRLNARDEYKGTGIGLAVCKRIVERHAGQIGVESVYGEGSTFWFTIPGVSKLTSDVPGMKNEVKAGA